MALITCARCFSARNRSYVMCPCRCRDGGSIRQDVAAVFGRTVFWGAAREGETAEEAWRRALRIDDVFRRAESVSEMHPLFAGLGGDLPDEESALREEYVTLQEKMGEEGDELPGWGKRSGGGLKTFTTKSQRHQGNKKAVSRKIFHLQIFVSSCLSG